MQITLDPWQKLFLETEGDKFLAAGRQVGKSVVCSMDAAEWAVKNKNQNILMIAPTERQAYALFEKTLRYLVEHYPRLIKKGKEKPTQSRVSLTNGVNIYCLPVGISGVGIRFITIGRLYIDECARIPREVIDAVTPALLTTGGDTIYLSTFDGTDPDNEFHNCWINKDGAYSSFTRFLVSSEQVVRERKICKTWTEKQRDKALEKLAQAKARMHPKIYAQEFLGIPAEDMLRFYPRELVMRCCVLGAADANVSAGKNYLGVDIARMGDDASSFQVIQKRDDKLLRHIYSASTRKTKTTDTYDEIIRLNEVYTCRQIGIDAGSGSLGVGILDFLMREDRIKNKVIALNNRARALDADGTRKTKLMKEDMHHTLRALMEHGKILLLADQEVIQSLLSVQYELNDEGMKVFSHYNSDIVEALMRAAYIASEDKGLNFNLYWM